MNPFSATPAGALQQRSPLSSQWSFRQLVGLGIFILLCLVLIAAYALWQSRENMRLEADVQATSMARSLERTVYRAVHESDLVLRTAADEYRRLSIAGHPHPAAFGDFLKAQQQRLPHVADLRASGSDGLLKFGRPAAPAESVNVADRDFFKLARDATGLVVASPVQAATGQPWVLPLARRLESAEGHFHGVIHADIAMEHFRDVFSGLEGGGRGRALLLLGSNADIYLRTPELPAPGGTLVRLVSAPQFKELRDAGHTSASYHALGTNDGVARGYSYLQVGDYPLYVMVGLAEADYLTRWSRQVVVTVLVLVLLGLLMLQLYRSLAQSLKAFEASQQRQAANAALFRTMVDGSPVGQLLVELTSLRVLTSNPAATEILGYRDEELRRRCIPDFDPGATPETILACNQELLTRGRIQFDTVVRRKDGTLRNLSVTLVRLDSADGPRIHATQVDITERIAREAELEKHRHHLQELVAERTAELAEANRHLGEVQFALDQVGIGIHWLDADSGRFLQVNQTACEMLGYRQEDMLRLGVLDIDPGFPKGEFSQAAVVLRRQCGTSFESENLHRDGRRIPVEVTPYFLEKTADQPARIIAFISDITRRKQAEQALVEAKEAAEVANRAKSTFLATMSHEIRTPMNAIVGLTHTLRRAGPTPEQAGHLARIAGAAEHLLGVINDILDISKIEAGKLTLEKADFDLEAELTRVCALVQGKAQAKGLELLIDMDGVPMGLHGDGTRLGQTLLNYLGNAVKFTERGTITLRARVLEETPQELLLRFEVQDTGIGIDADTLGRLFHAFEQADGSITRKYGGSGLGLAITRHLARLMGGDAGAASTPGSGSVFWFTARFGKGESLPGRHFIPALKGRRALVVDDQPATRLVLCRLLQLIGLRAESVDSGPAAVSAVMNAQHIGDPFDVVLFDLYMPALDGLETLSQLRRLPLASAPLPLLVTCSGDPHVLVNARRAGFAEVLVKPLSASMLHDSLQRHFLPHAPSPWKRYNDFDPEAEIRRDFGGAWLLLVDDDPLNQEVALELLSDTGLRVDVADNGQEALEMVRAVVYDLVLMDMQMPVMDGLAATRAIRALEQGGDMPILAMTANAFAEDRERCLAAGMNDFVSKPVEPPTLFEKLLKWLAYSRSQGGDQRQAELSGLE